ncbi:chorismate synthase activity protein [Rhizodiscina lignyota]|uniref:chorismate synthase n=1 Tax=Rhizodiscina lignyota TaxID=1504668 RepID=A0A9P4IN84_9PEZI|nr:chorismate synthase activity protein [Rhizodiscina lignyota]
MSSFGEHFRVTTYGESHCRSVGCIVENVPPGMQLDSQDIHRQLNRRRPGQSVLNSPRNEKDRIEIQSGIENGVTLGTPIALMVRNEDTRPQDYKRSKIDQYPRPSHADWTYLEKYGIKASSGGGRSSARETIGRVAAGAIAEKYLYQAHGIEIVAFVSSVGSEKLFPRTVDQLILEPHSEFEHLLKTVTREQVDSYAPVRCPHPLGASRMGQVISTYRDRKDSIGGSVTCVIRNAPTGLGEPAFHKLEAMLSFAMMSIPASKGFEIGSGFDGTEFPGSIHNDAFIPSGASSPASRNPSSIFSSPRLTTKTNNSGGVQGGISNGAPIYFRVGFKPPATIGKTQNTTSFDMEPGVLEVQGRHDPCVVPRAVPIVESMAAIVLMDAILAQQARLSARSLLPPIDQSQLALNAVKEMTINEKCEKRLLSVRFRGGKCKETCCEGGEGALGRQGQAAELGQ